VENAEGHRHVEEPVKTGTRNASGRDSANVGGAERISPARMTPQAPPILRRHEWTAKTTTPMQDECDLVHILVQPGQ